MQFIYLDESGDLGFNFQDKKPSNYFTITILVIDGAEDDAIFSRGIKSTIRRKFVKNKDKIQELKGTSTTLKIKEYFYKQIKNINFKIYSTTIDKKKLINQAPLDIHAFYNEISLGILKQINFLDGVSRIKLVVDKSKGKEEIKKFDNLIKKQLEIKNKCHVDIWHYRSQESKGLQACDLFSHGIFSNYENSNSQWLEVFKEKISYDEIRKVNSEPYKL
ncbi:MAG: hypothetical protein ACJAW3_001544 [Lentimonas sp.]